jgi:hypothetical protein
MRHAVNPRPERIGHPQKIVLMVARPARPPGPPKPHEGFMKPLRVSLATASLLLLCASTLSAQAARIACKDGSVPKVGHFTCWGHGGVVSVPGKKARATEKKPAARKPVAKKPVATVHKKKKADAKAAKHSTR